MRLAVLRLAASAWADHGGPLRPEGPSPLTMGLLAGALAVAVGVLVAVIVMLLIRRRGSPD